ncbi:tRNA preQ1(34) S-adenosylmethionine ribosyltransferase-isomerase QueA [Chitinivibrio alkaliphilus]|uniref:S-adenosylmethionine:tRNA ribosyltransferase-isomerase n=1 Tax=Chitinivibrio alkaliphilus ACht1 TaxID=1313304 RepID=U7D6F1_9BACT|nr:tRNA preQ1(34) S-adenosylmethionine ribosyltransferase-isomerase QueA [Chitinivibrio alkaliphilus]ERP31151.1 S-adenosylmethionine/tRNA-ribosyltransferase-isomerase [Chitinivibrio alkaliphilus ACht1]
MLKTSDFDYILPSTLIATRPLEDRASARMMVLPRRNKEQIHATFADLPRFLRKGDRLVFNDTRVIPGRVFAHRSTGASVEILFTEPCDSHTWKALVRPGRKMRVGDEVLLGNAQITVQEILPDGLRVLRATQPIKELMDVHGEMPIPPYMERHADEKDKQTYQTVYAKNAGAVAAPTAGLHFTTELLQELTDAGVDSTYITLHVGVGTFRPVSEENPLDHPMHSEYFHISPEAVEEIEETRRAGGRIIAVGTTVVRALEAASQGGSLESGERSTNLMIMPGYTYQIVDGLITNFHLPRSTLLMLVSAFYSREALLSAYEEAIRHSYRFYSYGDGMLLI